HNKKFLLSEIFSLTAFFPCGTVPLSQGSQAFPRSIRPAFRLLPHQSASGFAPRILLKSFPLLLLAGQWRAYLAVHLCQLPMPASPTLFRAIQDALLPSRLLSPLLGHVASIFLPENFIKNYLQVNRFKF
ncbi:MAG: hypothetical protein IKT16_07625, partial [Desulfovibrio sp.]|nr:hypothetical protein [Desulfovibrio sp.]